MFFGKRINAGIESNLSDLKILGNPRNNLPLFHNQALHRVSSRRDTGRQIEGNFKKTRAQDLKAADLDRIKSFQPLPAYLALSLSRCTSSALIVGP